MFYCCVTVSSAAEQSVIIACNQFSKNKHNEESFFESKDLMPLNGCIRRSLPQRIKRGMNFEASDAKGLLLI